MKTLILLVSILFYLTCYNIETQQTVFVISKDSSITYNRDFKTMCHKIMPYRNGSADILDNSFANNPFGFDTNTLKTGIDTSFFRKTWNLNPTIVIDTLQGPGEYYPYYIIYEKDFIFKMRKLASGKADAMGQYVFIANQNIRLANGLKIGMSKKEFLNKFNAALPSDTIEIDNEDGTTGNFFIFKTNVLAEIYLSITI